MTTSQIPVFNFSVKNQTNDSLDIFVDGYIVDAQSQEMYQQWFGDTTSVSYKSLRNQVEQANPKTIDLWVNSGGGHVGDAMAFHDYLIDLESKGITVNRHGRGIIASAATFFIVGKNSDISDNSFFMIHNVSSFIYGDIKQMEKQFNACRVFNDRIINFFVEKTGKSKEVITDWMDAETWMDAQTTVDRGFVNKKTDAVKIENSIPENTWPFQNKSILNQYNSSILKNKTDIMDLANVTSAVESAFTKMLEKLGIVNKKDEQPVKDAFKEFTDNIVNALSQNAAAPLDEAKVTEIVNAALVAQFNKIGENAAFQTAITESTKGLVTSELLQTSLNTMKDSIVTSLEAALSKGTGKAKGEKPNNGGNGGNKNSNSKFAGYQDWSSDNFVGRN